MALITDQLIYSTTNLPKFNLLMCIWDTRENFCKKP